MDSLTHSHLGPSGEETRLVVETLSRSSPGTQIVAVVTNSTSRCPASSSSPLVGDGAPRRLRAHRRAGARPAHGRRSGRRFLLVRRPRRRVGRPRRADRVQDGDVIGALVVARHGRDVVGARARARQGLRESAEPRRDAGDARGPSAAPAPPRRVGRPGGRAAHVRVGAATARRPWTGSCEVLAEFLGRRRRVHPTQRPRARADHPRGGVADPRGQARPRPARRGALRRRPDLHGDARPARRPT